MPDRGYRGGTGLARYPHNEPSGDISFVLDEKYHPAGQVSIASGEFVEDTSLVMGGLVQADVGHLRLSLERHPDQRRE